MKFLELVEEYRVKRGLTKSEVARRVGISRETFWRVSWEEGPRLRTALRIMEELRIPYERLAEVEL